MTENGKYVTLTDASFKTEVLDSDVPVLVDFWAAWCGPCRMLAPALVQIAQDYAGHIKVAKLNVDENTQTTMKYGIRSIPTLMLFRNGEIIATKVGTLSKGQLTSFIETNVSH